MNAPVDVREHVTQSSMDEMFERAWALVPVLRARAVETESIRRIPDETMADLDRLGLFAAFSPPSFGGLGGDMHQFGNMVRVLAHGCASTAWVWGFLVGHNVALLQNTPHLLAGRPFVAAGASAGVQGNPAVTATPVEGGWRVTGTWKFVSGIMNSDYALLVTLQDNGAEPPTPLGLVVAVTDGDIDDVWYFSGMKGTGSNTFHLNDVFVPESQRWGVWGVEQLHPPIPDSNMNVSIVRLFDAVLTAATVGIVEAALDDFKNRVLTRTIGYGQGPQREHREAWARYSDAVVRTRTARLLWDDLLNTISEPVRTGIANTPEQGALVRLEASRVATLSREALNVIADGSGSSVHHESDPLQRGIRDIETIKSHATLHWDHAAVTSGSLLLGLADQVDPLIIG